MAAITIRKLDDEVKTKLRLRAAQHGRSMEAEARDLIERAVASSDSLSGKSFGEAMHELFHGLGWDGSTLPSRDVPPRYVDFDK
jgi:plasmid stability protein